MKEVFNYSITYYYSQMTRCGYSIATGNCVFRLKSDAEAEMNKKIESLSNNKNYGELRLHSTRVYPIEVK